MLENMYDTGVITADNKNLNWTFMKDLGWKEYSNLTYVYIQR